MNTFTRNAIKVIQSIPKGKVLSYGRIAMLAGSPYGARQVGWILSGMTDKYKLPWQRVVNSKLKISIKDPLAFTEQKAMLINEGVIFKKDDTIDASCLWQIDFMDLDLIELKEL